MSGPQGVKIYPLTYDQAVVVRTELTDALGRWEQLLADRPYDWRIPTRRIEMIKGILATLPPVRPRLPVRSQW